MPIKDTIEKLDELRNKATQREWDYGILEDEKYGVYPLSTAPAVTHATKPLDCAYIVALHNSYESLRNAALKQEEYAEKLIDVQMKLIEANNELLEARSI